MDINNAKLGFILSVMLAALPSSGAGAEMAGVVATIKPLYALVSGVMGDSGTPALLLGENSSPHDFHLKPSQVKALWRAKLIFYIDDGFETFLIDLFKTLPGHVKKIALAQKAGLALLPRRAGGAWDAHQHDHGHGHDHDDDHDDHDEHKNYDMHVWLDPKNAVKMVATIAQALSAVYPENRDIYRANARRLIKKINRLDAELKALLSDVRDKPFIVFHDAYPYFERAYNLKAVGAITVEPDQSPSPRRIREIKARLKETGAKCVFREPQFPDRLVKTIIQGTEAKSGTLDPLGVGLADGENLYFNLLRNLARNLKRCLSG